MSTSAQLMSGVPTSVAPRRRGGALRGAYQGVGAGLPMQRRPRQDSASTNAGIEAQFLEMLPTVERIIVALARRNRLRGDDADDFASVARTRLIENDYAVLRKFRGASSLTTYLTVVIATVLRDYRISEWGRWRSSAAACRRGTLAVKLEILTRREGFALAQAGEALRTSGATTLTDRELCALADHFPERAPLRPVQSREAPADVPSPMRADEAIEEEEHIAHFNTVRRALSTALMSLDPEARLIVHMHFVESMSLADIARGLSIPQKPLYRRLHRALVTLRLFLERTGITQRDAHEVVDRYA